MKRKSQPGYLFVKKVGDISEYRLLANNLQVLLMPQPEYAGIIGISITYRVGSRHEAVGYTGATHLLEHLMFKESKNFQIKDNNTIKHLLEKRGAEINAMTWSDATCYYAMLPSNLVSTALAIEKDRMRNAFITKKHLDSEMTVVRNELEWGENNPHKMMYIQTKATAFQAHPYHHPVIGWRSDVENMPIEKLQWFYDEYYHPNNATLFILGDFDQAKLLQQVRSEFGSIPAKKDLVYEPYTTEPEQLGERSFRIHKTGEDIVTIAYKIPDARHADMPALHVLSGILDSGKSSRLYKAFIDDGYALNVNAYSQRQHDPSLFMFVITLASKLSHDNAVKKLDAEIRKLQTSLVTSKEIAKARSTIRMGRAKKTENAFDVIDYMADCISQGNWDSFYTFADALDKVTAKDIQRVAKKYFVDATKTTGFYVKTN